jgi:hypothetical protein
MALSYLLRGLEWSLIAQHFYGQSHLTLTEWTRGSPHPEGSGLSFRLKVCGVVQRIKSLDSATGKGHHGTRPLRMGIPFVANLPSDLVIRTEMSGLCSIPALLFPANMTSLQIRTCSSMPGRG